MKYTKPHIVTFVTFLITVSLAAQQPAAKPAQQQAAPVKLSSAADTVQYTLGAFIGQWFVKNGFGISNQALFKRGMDDVMQKKPTAIPDSVIAPLVANYQLIVQSARSRQLEDQLFAALKGKPGVGVLPNGVHYIVVKAAQGLRPNAADTVVINAIGVFPDGTVFEDTFKKKQPITTATNKLIPGLSEAIQLMTVDSVWRIFVPSVLGYGTAGVPNLIPPNTALVYDITLMEVR
ncbi:MAG TPA: FKBP-type peptidyl-prolyl cis-trans isomerase [Bacteroidales bacterium]|nr:FKBP-type peptidyl-prolyl cis-trans isomerase [Bacteroidales bacterium]